MTRTEKYKLKIALIELENALQELTNYCEIRKAFDDMFEAPMNLLQELMPVDLKANELRRY